MISSELLSEQRDADAQFRAKVKQLVADLNRIYPPFPDYLVGGAKSDLLHDLEFWTREADEALEQEWRDLAAEADELEAATEADFRNDLKWENA